MLIPPCLSGIPPNGDSRGGKPFEHPNPKTRQPALASDGALREEFLFFGPFMKTIQPLPH